MIPIKVQCGCGQRYAFDVEPIDGRMPYAVACPICGADGTTAAEQAIALTGPPRPIVAVPIAAVRLPEAPPLAATARPRAGRPAGVQQPDRAKTEAEARSKILWGDAGEEVVKFAMMQGIPCDQARALIAALLRERVTMLRGIGVQKILTGVGLMCVPVVAFAFFKHIGFLPLKVFAVAVSVGLYGFYLLLRGLFMVLLPKMESGEIADK